MAEVSFSRPQGRIRVTFPEGMDLSEVRDAIVNHMSVAILARRSFDNGEPSNPPVTGRCKSKLKEDKSDA